MEQGSALVHPIKDAASQLRVSVSSIYRFAESGRLRIIKLGSRSLVTDASLRQLVAKAPELVIRRAKYGRSKARR